MTALPHPIEAYIAAYNALDVPGMLACLHDDVVFRNFTGDTMTAEAVGKPAFAEMAAFGATAFSQRRQTVTQAITVADRTMLRIAYEATVARDLPNGWTAGQHLAFDGASYIEVRDGLIVQVIDQS